MNAFLLLLPQWVTAIFFPLAMLGFASWNTPIGRRAAFSASAFVILFAFVGQPFNPDRGLPRCAAPLPGAATQAPAAIKELVHAIKGLRNTLGSASPVPKVPRLHTLRSRPSNFAELADQQSVVCFRMRFATGKMTATTERC